MLPLSLRRPENGSGVRSAERFRRYADSESLGVGSRSGTATNLSCRFFQPGDSMRTSTALLIGLILAGCTGADDTPDASADSVAVTPAAPDSLSIAGFSTPESVLYDEVGDVYLVSNINGA